MLQPMLDGGDRARNFSGGKSFAAARALVVEQNTVTRAQSVALAIVDRGPVGKHFRDAVGTARPERCALVLRHFAGVAEHFAAGSLIKTRPDPRFADRFQDSDRADAGDVGSVFRDIEAHAHMAL